MRKLILPAITLTICLILTTAHARDAKPKEDLRETVFEELSAGLPKVGQRARSARAELDYWHEHHWGFLHPPERKAVKTKDGKAAEVIFLTAPSLSLPGEDFSMAFLVVQKRVVDWASCWTYNRTATQELMLEDVDGDGNADVAFRASGGWFGLVDKRQHGRPRDKRKWLYAYAITSIGFQSLFPAMDRDLKVKVSYDTASQPIQLEAKGLPESLRERQMVECTLSATNTSRKEIAIQPGMWYSVNFDSASCFMTRGLADKRTVLKSGESISQVVRFHVAVDETVKELPIRWSFVPSQ